MMNRLLCFIVVLLTLISCQIGKKPVLPDGQKIELTYAENLRLTEADGYVQAVLRNPWDTTTSLQTYLLVPKDKPLPEQLPQGLVVRTPLEHSLVYSAVHCSLLDELGKVGAISGVCDRQYIKVPTLQEGLDNGNIADCGNHTAPNIEAIIQLNPDAILLSPYQNSGDFGKVGKLNIPIIQCADYVETSALGRAEWVKFYGLLFGCEKEASQLFEKTANRYNELKAKAETLVNRPNVLSDTRYGQVWYVPGANSTTARLYNDAGGKNPFDYLGQIGSVALSPEQVLDKANNADVWIIKYNRPKAMTLQQMVEENEMNAQFKAF
ncbi:MAG: ABC transporter substrate-binding protein, partial [Bacteroidaceae bacterium]|nr:ABC transporter substrate-binding protein [Bacteroidaceae bacterium]